MLDFLAPRLSPAYRDCKVPLLLVTMLGDFVQGQYESSVYLARLPDMHLHLYLPMLAIPVPTSFMLWSGMYSFLDKRASPPLRNQGSVSSKLATTVRVQVD